MKEKRSHDVLLAFKDRAEEVSTSDIAAIVYHEEFGMLGKILGSVHSPPPEIRKAKSAKAVLHRRVLYHLNRLMEHGLVRLTRTDSNGEKYYTLGLNGNEELVFEDYRKRTLVLTKPRVPSLPTEAYEEKHVLVKFSGETWLETANALLLDMQDLPSMFRAIGPLYSEINDVIGISNFAMHANSAHDAAEFLKRTGSDAKDFGKRINLLVDVAELDKDGKQRILQMLKHCAASEQPVSFVLEMSSKDVQTNFNFLQQAFASYEGRKLYFKNKDITSVPYLTGKAGPYTFDATEMKRTEGSPVLLASQMTLMVDVKKFCETFSFSFEAFDDLIQRTLKSLFYGNAMQRRHAGVRFKNTMALGGTLSPFVMARDYIRFWNYDFLRLTYDAKMMENVFRLIRKRAKEFCTAQESIYASCGMPARFRSVFSMAHASLSSDYFTTALDRSRLEVSALKDFYDQGFRENMRSKELLTDMFDGGFQLTVHKKGPYNTEDAVREVNMMLNTYKIPFFAYAADAPKGTLKNLKSFA
ncbi:MAG: hypothetical protein HY366_00720 [Candidatus Aenigmarchaeota archaeon]|nr:hypothetical protein [Candidatus Aenigmarchaeota archaeon]